MAGKALRLLSQDSQVFKSGDGGGGDGGGGGGGGGGGSGGGGGGGDGGHIPLVPGLNTPTLPVNITCQYIINTLFKLFSLLCRFSSFSLDWTKCFPE